MINFSNVSKTYKKKTEVFKNLSMSIDDGDFVVMVGAPGTGKTTFLKMILNEELPSSGEIFYEQNIINKLSTKNLKKYRRNIGVIFQDLRLLPHKTIFENVAFSLEVQGANNDDIFKDTLEVLDIVGVLHKKDNFPHELSGGEKQKVAIARALINRPKIILADEPTGSLDEHTAKEIIHILKAINSLGTTIIMTTHNERLVTSIKGSRKMQIRNNGIIYEPLKALSYGVQIEKILFETSDAKKIAEVENLLLPIKN